MSFCHRNRNKIGHIDHLCVEHKIFHLIESKKCDFVCQTIVCNQFTIEIIVLHEKYRKIAEIHRRGIGKIE